MVFTEIMKKIYLLLVIFSTFQISAQEDAWIYFNSKPNSQFYFDNPLEMLSQRSLDRRAAQGITLDIKDIPIYQPYIDQVDAVSGIEVMAKSKWLNAVHVRGSEIAINSVQSFSFVAEVDFADNSLDAAGKVSSKLKRMLVGKQMNVQADFAYGASANQIQMLNGHLLHQQDYTGVGKIIAVLDAGFPEVDVVQPFARLRDNNQILGGYNFVDRNEDFYSRNSHGTLVLSTMGGYAENQLVGTAPDAGYYLFITEDINSENPVEESLWVEAAEVADSLGVDIINSSLGYFDYDNPAYSYSYEDMDGTTSFVSRGADIAFTRGMVVVVSAGNSGNSGDPHISVPADAINVLTVGAVTASGNYASFSSIGPSADGRIKPDVMAQGQSAVLSNTSGNITTASGTSFSGPIMAGMVASFWQAAPTLTNAQVVQLIRESAHLYENPTDEMGYGIPDFAEALSLAELSVPEEGIDGFQVYPNPFSNMLSVSFPSGTEKAQLKLYNNLGQLVAEKSIVPQVEITGLEQLAPGIYFYYIASAEKARSGKLIKTNSAHP